MYEVIILIILNLMYSIDVTRVGMCNSVNYSDFILTACKLSAH